MLGLVFLAILLLLGFWQLERAAEKQQLLDHIAAQQAQAPLALEAVDNLTPAVTADGFTPGPSLTYRRVTVTGRFDPQRYWLLDNQVQQGVVGYHVIGVFEASPVLRVLVNRGWIAAPLYRDQLPVVEWPAGLQTLTGRMVMPADNPLLKTAPQNPEVSGWPLRIQELALRDAERQLGITVFPALLQLAPDDPAALVMEWRDVNVSVSKHQGYAVQWFAMAVALVVALVFANTDLSKKISASAPSHRDSNNYKNTNNRKDRGTGS